MPKQLPKFIREELAMHGWENVGTYALDGFVWQSAGIELHIVPSRMGKMYHVSKTKMSESTTTFITEAELLSLLTEGERK